MSRVMEMRAEFGVKVESEVRMMGRSWIRLVVG
jgi:hypothetical protein